MKPWDMATVQETRSAPSRGGVTVKARLPEMSHDLFKGLGLVVVEDHRQKNPLVRCHWAPPCSFFGKRPVCDSTGAGLAPSQGPQDKKWEKRTAFLPFRFQEAQTSVLTRRFGASVSKRCILSRSTASSISWWTRTALWASTAAMRS